MTEDDDEITEEVVEGIYIEHQYKIENIPGYAEAYERAYKLMKRIIDDDRPVEPDDGALGSELAAALFECYFIDVTGGPKRGS